MLDWAVPLWADFMIFAVAAAAIALAGTKTAGYADRLADRAGLGEALTGTLLLGLITALPGLAASVVAAMKGHPGLAYSNALGGIAVQTAALGVADLAYRKANLEHAAASAANMMQTIMLILLITITLGGVASPDVTIGHIHPASIVLILAAGMAFWLAYRTWERPMWRPRHTDETVLDVPAPGHEDEHLPTLIIGLVVAAGITAVAGAAVAESGENIVAETPIPETVIGGLFMAVATSLPELVTSVAAVRRGALTLAVSDIVGGNFFDILFVAAADIAYIHGSLYHAPGIGAPDIFLTVITILMNAVLLMGLIYRQKRGPANIGFESVGMLAIYVVGFVILFVFM